MKTKLIFIVIILFSISSYAYLYWQKQNTPVVQSVKNKTYSSQDLGITFQYPEDWQLVTDNNTLSIEKDKIIIGIRRFSKSDLPKGYSNIDAWFSDLKLHKERSLTPNDGFYYGPGSDSPYKWYMNYQFTDMRSISIGQTEGVVTSNNGMGISYIVLPTSQFVYEINLQPLGIYTEPVVTQILSTFKFTDQVNNIVDWKTYTNNKTGFALQYPSNLKLYERDPSVVELRFFDEEKNEVFDIDANEKLSLEEIKKDTDYHKYLGQIKAGNYVVEKYTTPGFEFVPLDTYALELGDHFYTMTITGKISNTDVTKILSTFELTN